MLLNLFLGDKHYDIKNGKKKVGKRHVRCNDIVLCGHYLDELKWGLVRDFYKKISHHSHAHYEDVTFTAIKPNKIPDPKYFKNVKRRTVIIFEDLCTEPKNNRNYCIFPYFVNPSMF